MTVDEYLGELRKRIIWILIVLMVTMVAGFVLASPVISFFEKLALANGMEWNVFHPGIPCVFI